MTEEEWFASGDARPMLAAVAEQAHERQLRLFGCACLRTVTGLPWEVEEAVKYVEKYCDELLSWGEVVGRVQRKAFQANQIVVGTHVYGFRFPPLLGDSAIETARSVIDYCVSDLTTYSLAISASPLTHLLRDIVGNPFRPIAFSPAWRTSDAVALARTMYDAREFGAMPILADALQDAGCDSDDILNHMRDAAQVHVRGCWVIDLVLGKA